MNARDYILLEYADLLPGTSAASQLCPECKGGSAGERTLSVTRTDSGLTWFCHRASCGFKGGAGTSQSQKGSAGRPSTKPVQARAAFGRQLAREVDSLPDDILAAISGKYRMAPATLNRWGCGWYDSMLLMPIWSLQGDISGCMLRTVGEGKKIATSYAEPHSMSWYLVPLSRSLVIVEDQLSAMRLWQAGVPAVALLGTHLNDEKIDELRGARFRNVLIALDKDATNKAVEYSIKFRSRLRMNVMPIHKDFKDQTEQELTSYIDGLRRPV